MEVKFHETLKPVQLCGDSVDQDELEEKQKQKKKVIEKQEDEVECENEKKQKSVAARNEADEEVSAAALEEEKEDEIIGNIPPKETKTEDQWSPFNPDGKKKYERDFLMKLKDTTEAKKQPEICHDVLNSLLKDNVNRMPRLPNLSTGTQDNFKTSQSFRGRPVTKLRSQQSVPKSVEKLPITQCLLQTSVKLHETENPWKPTRLRGGQAEQDKTADLYKKLRGILNKLTPQNILTLMQQVQALPINNSEKLHGVVDMVFEKAVDEPSYSVVYAQMCKVLSNMQVTEGSEEGQPENFHKLLLSRCQHEFEKNTRKRPKRNEPLEEIEQCTDPEKKKELEEVERRLRMKCVGNIRFIGELFKLGMLTPNIMHRCIQTLLKRRDEKSLECLCKLLTTIGQYLPRKKHALSKYFRKMKLLSKQRGQISFHVRFMLQDVIELRANKWVPQQDDSAPKTIDQIQHEAGHQWMMEMQIPSGGGGVSRGGGIGHNDQGGDTRKRRGRCVDWWQSVQRKNLDTSKLHIRPSDLMDLSLSGSNQFAARTQGVGGNSDSDLQTSDTYAALQAVGHKKGGVATFSSQPHGKQPPLCDADCEKAVNAQQNLVCDKVSLSPEAMAIHAKLLQMLRPEQGAPATADEVTEWISANVGDRANTPEFIRVLTTAVCEASISKKFAKAFFSKYSVLLQKYIDTNEELQLHCLYAVQELNHRLEQPSDLLCWLFLSLWDYGCVGSKTLFKWEQSKDPAFLQGKGIALKSLTVFFTALREADDDSSEEYALGK